MYSIFKVLSVYVTFLSKIVIYQHWVFMSLYIYQYTATLL